jgi:hypothetical protein
MSRRGKLGIPGLSFSWKRAIGISGAKGRLSRMIGIPLTQSGGQRKMRRAMGCCVVLGLPLLLAILAAGWCACSKSFKSEGGERSYRIAS